MAPQEEPQGNNCSDRVNSIFKTLYRLLFSGGITLEPGIFCILVGTFFVSGPEISTNLLLWKICHIKFGYNETVCDNLSADENNDIENEVQIAANNFKLSETFVIAAPGFIAAIFAGALSDRYGRKKLMIVPMFGHFLAAIFGLINYAFIEVLPLQFFYLEQTFHFFGGQSLYYMGLYSYGADITPEKERVVRFCRWDATELIGVIVGSALSPLLYKWAGPYASYSGFILLQGTAILYFYFFIKEKPRNSDEEEKQTVSQESCMQKFRGIWEIYVKQPILDFIVTLKKKRDGQKSTMIRVLLVIYAFYYLILANYGQLYLYMIKAFPGFNGESYAYYTMYSFTIGIVGLLIYVPLTKRALKWHESAIACFSTTCMAVGLIVAAFVKTAFPGFYLARLIIGFENCIFSTARSMMTRCVDGNEVGKMFAIIAISAPLARVSVLLLYNIEFLYIIHAYI